MFDKTSKENDFNQDHGLLYYMFRWNAMTFNIMKFPSYIIREDSFFHHLWRFFGFHYFFISGSYRAILGWKLFD